MKLKIKSNMKNLRNEKIKFNYNFAEKLNMHFTRAKRRRQALLIMLVEEILWFYIREI